MDNDGSVRYVSVKEGVLPWAKCAHEVLVETASSYGGYISSAALAAEVQRRARRATRSGPKVWLPEVLSLVVKVCARAGEPPLTALVVDARNGDVGAAYDEVLALLGPGSVEPGRREDYAAVGRLECYRRFCAELPPDAAPHPVVVPRMTSARGSRSAGAGESFAAPKQRKSRSQLLSTREAGTTVVDGRPGEQRQGDVCLNCSMVMPLRGGCPNCG